MAQRRIPMHAEVRLAWVRLVWMAHRVAEVRLAWVRLVWVVGAVYRLRW